jgi:drug/metabolite transporter (DMT)-like permease
MINKNKKITGGLELLLASAIYGLYGLFYRNISNFGDFSQGFLRSAVIMSILLTIFIINKKKWQPYKKKDLKWFVIWIIPSSLQPVMTFIAFNKLPVSLVYYLLYAAMIISSFLSGMIFYKEKLNIEKIISLIFVLIGITFIYGSNISFVTNIYVIFALLSGFTIGIWNTLTKKLSGNYSEEQMIFSDNLMTFIICLIVAILVGESLPNINNYMSYIWLIIFSLITLTTGVLIVKGFNKVEAQLGSLITPMEIVFGSIVGYFFLNETLSKEMYLGGFFILLAATLPYIIELIKKKKS